MPKHSTNYDRHPYLRGYTAWKDRIFWRNQNYTPASQAYYDNWLEEMRLKERSLIRLS